VKITNIEKLKGTKYNVYSDDELLFSSNEEELYKFGIYTDKEFTEEEIEDIQKYIGFTEAKSKALKYISYKKRSSYEVTNRLLALGFNEKVTNNVISYLEESDYINDYEYAKKYIKYLSENRVLGIKRIKAELKKKGISNVIIEEHLDEIDTSEYHKAEKLIKKKFKLIKEINIRETEKIKNFLYKKGYTNETINSVLENVLARENYMI
jgi:regulatory protein